MQSRPLNIFREILEKIFVEHFEQRCHHALSVRSQTRTNAPRVSLDVQPPDGPVAGEDGAARLCIKVQDHEERENAVLNGLLEVASFFHGHDLPSVEPYVVTDIIFHSASLERQSTAMKVEGTAVFDIFYVWNA